jgi:hypothetical protein
LNWKKTNPLQQPPHMAVIADEENEVKRTSSLTSQEFFRCMNPVRIGPYWNGFSCPFSFSFFFFFFFLFILFLFSFLFFFPFSSFSFFFSLSFEPCLYTDKGCTYKCTEDVA